MTDTDMTGRWVGHYSQADREFPITAELVQDGDRLTGSMRDGHPIHEYSLFEAAAAAGLPPGADEEIEADLRAALPDLPRGPVRVVTNLPPESRLDGQRYGAAVEFHKTYRGSTIHEWRVGNRSVEMEQPSHAVRYEGQLDPTGQVIEGRWVIDADPVRGTPRLSGSFSLRRVCVPGQASRAWWKVWG